MKIKTVGDNKTLQEGQEILLKKEAEIVGLKLKAFNTQMNPHFVFNALNAIQQFITSENKKEALEYLSVFSKLIRFFLSYLEEETVILKDEINMLNWYLKLQTLRYHNQFQYAIEVDKTQNAIQAKLPTSILQTVIENTLEYAIFNQYKNLTLSLVFSISPLTIEVKIILTHNPHILKKILYTPEYRESILKWQDQIRLLNTLYNYNIEKHVTFIKTKTHVSGSTIILKLPNLA